MRCDICNLESEADAKYCRKCGTLINMLPKDSAEESAAKHNMQDKAVNSNATSMLGADFSHPASPKMVVPLSKRDGGSTSAGRYRRRKLQIIWFSVAVLVVQIGIAVITFIRLPKPTLQPTTGQAQSHLNDGPTQASSVPPATGDNSAQKTAQAATSPPASEETIAEYNKKIDEQQQTIAENKKKIDEQQRKINNLEKKLVFEAGKLEHSKTEFLETAQQRDKLEADMKRETLRLKKVQTKAQAAVAQFNSKKREFDQLSLKLTGLKKEIAKGEITVRGIRRELASMSPADDSSLHHRSFGKGKSSPSIEHSQPRAVKPVKPPLRVTLPPPSTRPFKWPKTRAR